MVNYKCKLGETSNHSFEESHLGISTLHPIKLNLYHMNMKQRKLVLSALLLTLVLGTIKAQEAVASAGGESSGSGGSVSYTLGQTFYSTHDGTTASIAEGVQQAIEVSVVTGIIETA